MKFILQITGLTLTILSVLTYTGCNHFTNIKEKQQTKSSAMINMNEMPLGAIGGQQVLLFTLSNSNGMVVKISNFGGIITHLIVPDNKGIPTDVVAGFDNLQEYLDGHPYFGCIVGRYANRIAKGRFELEGNTYYLAQNNGENHLHGGNQGLDKKVWRSSTFHLEDEAGVRLEYTSPDGEEGYPGNLKVTVLYSLTENNELKIDYSAETDVPSPVNLTHHGYFNLNGHGEGDILGHELFINADRFTEINDQLIPTGLLPEVDGTPMDFRAPKLIHQDFARVPGGYDHNFVLNNTEELNLAARLVSAESGIAMEVLTTQPGIQFYTGNFLDGTLTGKNGKVYYQHYALCLETQHFPDSPNQPHFPSTILRPGDTFHHRTIYRFSTIK